MRPCIFGFSLNTQQRGLDGMEQASPIRHVQMSRGNQLRGRTQKGARNWGMLTEGTGLPGSISSV